VNSLQEPKKHFSFPLLNHLQTKENAIYTEILENIHCFGSFFLLSLQFSLTLIPSPCQIAPILFLTPAVS